MAVDDGGGRSRGRWTESSGGCRTDEANGVTTATDSSTLIPDPQACKLEEHDQHAEAKLVEEGKREGAMNYQP